jgi:hypothetical protein
VFNLDLYKMSMRYLDDTNVAQLMDESEVVYVDDYVKRFLEKYLENKNEEELQEFIKVIEKLASFYARLRVESNNLLGEKILERMMDEADKEAEEGFISDNNHGLIRLDSEKSTELLNKFEHKSEEE